MRRETVCVCVEGREVVGGLCLVSTCVRVCVTVTVTHSALPRTYMLMWR